VNNIQDPSGWADGSSYTYDYYGTIIADLLCLKFDPKSSTCASDFSFFAMSSYDRDVNTLFSSFLGLAPISKLNGQSII
jgi:hypothetical protein